MSRCGKKPIKQYLTFLLAGTLCLPAQSADTLATLNKDAQTAYISHQYESAADKYKKAISLASSVAPTIQIVLWSNYGAALREGLQFEEAQKAFKQAITIAERQHLEHTTAATNTMRQYAVLLKRMGKHTDALALENRASGIATPETPTPVAREIVPSKAALAAVTQRIEAASKEPGSSKPTFDFDKMTADEIKKFVEKHGGSNPKAWYVVAYKYQKEKNWSSAIAAYQNLDKQGGMDFAEGHGNYALCLMKNGQPREAIEQIKKATELAPEDGDLYLMMHNAQVMCGDLKGALATLQTFVDKFPDHEEHQSMSKVLQKRKSDMEAKAKDTSAPGEPTQRERILNWPASYMPLKVYINTSGDEIQLGESKKEMTERTATEVIHTACQKWHQASRGLITFTLVQKPEDANLEFGFTSDPTGMESEHAAGVTQWSGYGELPKARVTLLTTSSGSMVTPEELMDTTLHELGHALGLEHSNSIADIMYPFERAEPILQLSEEDSRRIQKLYRH